MPITLKQFERGSLITNKTKKENYVVDFLKANSNKAYKTPELEKLLKKSGSMVRLKIREELKEKKPRIEKKLITVKKGIKTPYYRAIKKK